MASADKGNNSTSEAESYLSAWYLGFVTDVASNAFLIASQRGRECPRYTDMTVLLRYTVCVPVSGALGQPSAMASFLWNSQLSLSITDRIFYSGVNYDGLCFPLWSF